MKIDPSSGKSTLAPAPRSGERVTAPASTPTSGVPSDNVTLNPLAAQMGEGSEGAGSFDAARVQSIRQAIADGRFQIRPEAIADKLIASVEELLRD
ncbi:MAG TPA: flagellar biosynthesis anti-sigma factor FlgM [Chitinolyticbacter sp.]|uniref:flagellar biosynthesis anti-sigma factor FlgM n=1 Tax=Chitinolyticbacter albus TaxID=2961951 RepID=UPI00210C0603|nr:flagellar biosynthesis anti-sigma factor FlgM [Chitinolyticbacter albus]HSC79802.1 flagellar biosynthesis anti-sigma factor FlgM [Chitinolyticbacter sp.]